MAYEWHQYIKPDTKALNELFQESANQVDDLAFKRLFPDVFFDQLEELRKEIDLSINRRAYPDF